MGVFTYWPNRITAIRFLGSVVIFILLAVYGQREPEEIRGVLQLCFWLFVVTAATDFLDGYLARRDHHVTAFGRIADPFTDKVLVVGILVFMAVMPWSAEFLPAWMVVVVVSREFLVTGIRGYVESLPGQEFPADRFGKIKMLLQCVAIGLIFIRYAHAWPQGLADFIHVSTHAVVWATVAATVGSGFTYVLKTQRILERVEA